MIEGFVAATYLAAIIVIVLALFPGEDDYDDFT